MELRYSAAEEGFRFEVREWLARELPKLPPPPDRDDWAGRRRFDTEWQRRLYHAGYAGLSWPVEHGGRGASPTEQLVFLEETARARAPHVGVNLVGMSHAGPTLIVEGTEEQRARHLPRILRGEEVWCQAFSEPDAGSDLAALRTRAEPDGDHYVVNGSKAWCSFGQVADYCELLVRTDPTAPKHVGITWLILPMDTPGIHVIPVRTVLGSSELCEVFLDDVRVSMSARVGAENDGWRVTQVPLPFEQGTALVGEVVDSLRLVEDLAPLVADAGHRRELGRCAAELDALWSLAERHVSRADRGDGPDAGAGILKLAYSEVRQRFGELCVQVLGREALVAGGQELVEERLRSLALTIAAGSSQIQRNIVAERVLGLPKERPWTST